jgi:hypothetical protein
MPDCSTTITATIEKATPQDVKYYSGVYDQKNSEASKLGVELSAAEIADPEIPGIYIQGGNAFKDQKAKLGSKYQIIDAQLKRPGFKLVGWNVIHPSDLPNYESSGTLADNKIWTASDEVLISQEGGVALRAVWKQLECVDYRLEVDGNTCRDVTPPDAPDYAEERDNTALLLDDGENAPATEITIKKDAQMNNRELTAFTDPAKKMTRGGTTQPRGLFDPFEWVRIYFHSDPIYAGIAQADATGHFSTKLKLDAGLSHDNGEVCPKDGKIGAHECEPNKSTGVHFVVATGLGERKVQVTAQLNILKADACTWDSTLPADSPDCHDPAAPNGPGGDDTNNGGGNADNGGNANGGGDANNANGGNGANTANGANNGGEQGDYRVAKTGVSVVVLLGAMALLLLTVRALRRRPKA